MKKRILFGALALFASLKVYSAVTLPYSFSSGQTIRASEVNANDQALRDGINNHASDRNAHNTRLQDVLQKGNSAGSYNIDFNLNQALSMLVERVNADPTCNSGSSGRLILNNGSGLLKFCNGSSFISIAGTGVNTLASVLSAGNTAGSSNIDLNYNQLLNGRVENKTSDPSAGSTGRLIFNSSSGVLKVDNGTSWSAVGGTQNLSSVLTTGNSAGSTNIDFNSNQAVKMRLENLSSSPSGSAGRVYYDTTQTKPYYYNGSTWKEIGNTNTLAQVLAIGNSAGSTNIDVNHNQLIKARAENLSASPGTGNAGRFWLNTSSGEFEFATGSASKTACSLDGTQTLTNKTISGSSNTISNIADSSLSSNVVLKDSTQTISGAKTFSTRPTMAGIKTASGASHTITDGLADDTFTLNNAVQTLYGKTLNAPSLSGNLDFNLYQAVEFKAENLSSNPATPTAGRMFYKTTTGEMLYGNGTEWKALTAVGTSSNTWSAVLSNGASAGSTSPDFNFNQALNMKLESLGSAPSSGNAGRVWWNSGLTLPQYDTGAAVKTFADTDSTQTLTGKTLAAGSNSITGTAARAAQFNSGTGALEASSITNTELGYLSGASSNLQSQISTNATDISTHIADQAAHGATSANTASKIVARDGSGNFSAGTITATLTGNVTGNVTGNLTGNVTGNADTATALASNPTDCSSNNFAHTIAANGNLTCAQVSDSYIAAGAAIARSKIAAGTNYQVVTNDGSGALTGVSPGTSGNVLTSDGTQWTSAANPASLSQPYQLHNVGLDSSVGSSALTVSLKQSDGSSNCSGGAPCKITFRSSTATTGSYSEVSVTGSLSVTVSSGSTLGHNSAQPGYVWVYAINNAGTVELAVAGSRIFDEASLVSTTAEGGAGAADSASVLYSTTARSNVAARLIGRMASTQTTAGTWATAMSEESVGNIPLSLQQRHGVQCDTSAGWGSTNTKVLRIASCATLGSAVTYSGNSSTLGSSFTINQDGMYVAQIQGAFSSAGLHGISAITPGGTAQLTTSIDGITQANRRCYSYCNGADIVCGCSVPMYLPAGTVVYPQGSGATLSSVTANTLFSLFKVGD